MKDLFEFLLSCLVSIIISLFIVALVFHLVYTYSAELDQLSKFLMENYLRIIK